VSDEPPTEFLQRAAEFLESAVGRTRAGADEIMRNILAERIIGLPRETSTTRDRGQT
jgi:hypothetical protein